MSFAVVRGNPEQSQLYLDGVLDSIIQDGVTGASTRDEVNLAELLYYCLKTHPEAIHSENENIVYFHDQKYLFFGHRINAATSEIFTNERILKRAVSIARALIASCAGETVIIMVRNHEHMSALFYAVLFAGIVPFMMEPGGTEYEIQQFLSLVPPRLIFCEPDRRDDVTNAMRGCGITAEVVVADGASLDKFVQGFSDEIESYQLPELTGDSTAFVLPTSGSTAVPKAAILNHRGLLMQIPSTWLYDTQFPHPTRLVMLLSTAQWLTHTIVMNTSPVYQVPILMSPVKITAEYFLKVAEEYRPTWCILGPSLASQIGHLGTSEQLSSLTTMYIGGSSFTPETLAALKEKLSASANLLNGYGMTEIQGHVAVGRPGTPLTTVGNVINILEYRIVNSDGEDVSKPFEKGELYLRTKFLFKGYIKNKAAYDDLLTPDGWLKTGDVFYTDENGQLFFANRTKLGFKCMNYQIYPEEIERVIGEVPGVQQSVVCGAEAGPAAAVVVQPGRDVSRKSIQQAVSTTLSDYKRLRGGIAFVAALPRTHNGKVHRARCLQLIQELIGKGECF